MNIYTIEYMFGANAPKAEHLFAEVKAKHPAEAVGKFMFQKHNELTVAKYNLLHIYRMKHRPE